MTDVGHREMFHSAAAATSQGPRFVLVIDCDGISVSLPRGKRLAIWIGSARRSFGLVEVFVPRRDWL